MSESILMLGAIVDYVIAIIFHGALWNETLLRFYGNAFDGYALLRRRGIYARVYLPNLHNEHVSIIAIKRSQKKLVMLVMCQNGYQCW